MRSPTWFEWVTVAAIVLGPILALMAQRALDALRERRRRRLNLFFRLMATRANHVAPAHVEALNSIDAVFDRDGDRDIRQAWEALLDLLDRPGAADWFERVMDVKADLLQKIGTKLGYTYSLNYLKRHIYSPKGHADAELDALQIRQTLAKVLTEDGLKVKVVEEGRARTAPAPDPPISPPARP